LKESLAKNFYVRRALLAGEWGYFDFSDDIKLYIDLIKGVIMYLTEYKRWNDRVTDSELLADLKNIAGSPELIEYYFKSRLEFGTAGLRGIMHAGINAMNIYTVRQATQGFSEYILAMTGEGSGLDRSCAIACDCRINSDRFSKECASVLAANGITVYIFESLRPTPELSFAIRHHGCAAGINITASHNPKQYNGYKAYWADGAQLAPDQAAEVSRYMSAVDIFDGVKTYEGGFEAGVKDGIIKVIGAETDEAYIEAVLAQRCDPSLIPAVADSLKVVYTPLHGTGCRIAPEVLRRAGLTKLFIPECQASPDGGFPTAAKPNPEFAQVFEPAKELALEVGADLIIATDPDADRAGLTIRDGGEFVTLNGNQIGSLLLDYILGCMKETSGIPADAFAVKTIVSTNLANRICESYGIEIREVLTGFRYIGEQIKIAEESGHGSFIFGFEESYGYLRGTHARDKDAIVATLLITEMAAFYHRKGMLLTDALTDLCNRCGWYRELTKNIDMDGLDGTERMKRMMASLRRNAPDALAGEKIVETRDYLEGIVRKSGTESGTGLTRSDVLYYTTEAGNTVIIRPSGTEPKVKVYLMVRGSSREDAAETLDRFDKIDFTVFAK